MIMKFFTSDGHIGHENILRLGDGRPFKSLGHMHATLIGNHNAVVGNDDDVYFLGDIAMGTLEDSIRVYQGMTGNKFFVPGNHDKLFSDNSKSYIEKHRKTYEDAGFTILPETTSVEIDGQEVLLSHFPYLKNSYGKQKKPIRHEKHHPADTGLPLLHGHTHQRENWDDNSRRMYHIGVDSNDFTPVSESVIIAWLGQLRTDKIL